MSTGNGRRNKKSSIRRHDNNDWYGHGFSVGRFVDEQLPDDEEEGEDFQETIPPEANLSTKLRRNPDHNYCWWCLGVLLLTGVVLLAVTLGVVVPEDRNNNNNNDGTTITSVDDNSSSSTSINNNSTTSRKDYLYSLVRQWSGETSLQDPNRASSQALNWLLNDDPFQLTENNGMTQGGDRGVLFIYLFV
jgi:hypothetical protein